MPVEPMPVQHDRRLEIEAVAGARACPPQGRCCKPQREVGALPRRAALDGAAVVIGGARAWEQIYVYPENQRAADPFRLE